MNAAPSAVHCLFKNINTFITPCEHTLIHGSGHKASFICEVIAAMTKSMLHALNLCIIFPIPTLEKGGEII